jgi:hypothetical protein
MTMAEEQMKTTHRYKIQPPTHDSNYSRFDQWKYLSRVHQRNIPRLLAQAKTSQQTITDQLITDGATNAAEGQLWGTRLAAYYILVSTTAAAAATIRRQMNINAKGFET